jgi:hypothetical protein
VLAAVILGGFCVQTTDAAPFTGAFGDNAFFWGDPLPGEGTATLDNSWMNGLAPYYYHDDVTDEIGNPQVQGNPSSTNPTASTGGGTYTLDIDGGLAYLQEVTINYRLHEDTWSQAFFDLLKVGDLFIDDYYQNGKATWDYVSESMETDGAVSVHDFSTTGGIALGSQNTPGTVYTMSGNDDTGYWAGWLIRDDHPWKLESYASASSSSTAQFAGWEYDTANLLTLSWDLTNGGAYDGIQLASNYDASSNTNFWDFGLGFTFNCGNDVVFETMGTSAPLGGPAPVPEPATLLLLTSGLVGIGARLRKR